MRPHNSKPTFAKPSLREWNCWIVWCNLLRSRGTGFQSGCTVSHSRPRWKGVPVLPQPQPRSSHAVFSILAVLCAHRHPVTVLICVSLMTNDVEHLFCTYWPFVYLFWRKVCSDPLPFFFNWGFISLLMNYDLFI